MTSYNRALEITRCESIETTLRTRRLLWAGTLLRMSGGRLPKRIVFGNLEGAVRRGRGEKEKEWTDCVQSDIRAFGITGDWKTMALKAEVWVDEVTEGGRRFMAAWREEEEDAARRRQEKREATRLGKLQSHTVAYNFAKRHPLAWPTSRRDPCTDARRIETTCVTPTCVAPRHVDASRAFLFLFSPNKQRARGGGGGGNGAARLFFFPVQQTTSEIGHRVK